MKTTRTKILFTLLLFSAVVPSGAQAGPLASARGSLTEVLSSSANSAKNRIADLFDLLIAIDKQISATEAIGYLLRVVPGFKYVGSGVIAAIFYELKYQFDLAEKIEKKRKEEWYNKWVRYSVYGIGTALTLKGLVVTLKALALIHEARESRLFAEKLAAFLSEPL